MVNTLISYISFSVLMYRTIALYASNFNEVFSTRIKLLNNENQLAWNYTSLYSQFSLSSVEAAVVDIFPKLKNNKHANLCCKGSKIELILD